MPHIAQRTLNFPKGKRRNIREYRAIASDKEVRVTSFVLNYFKIIKPARIAPHTSFWSQSV